MTGCRSPPSIWCACLEKRARTLEPVTPRTEAARTMPLLNARIGRPLCRALAQLVALRACTRTHGRCSNPGFPQPTREGGGCGVGWSRGAGCFPPLKPGRGVGGGRRRRQWLGEALYDGTGRRRQSGQAGGWARGAVRIIKVLADALNNTNTHANTGECSIRTCWGSPPSSEMSSPAGHELGHLHDHMARPLAATNTPP